jgi:hypothetical protein
MNFEAALRNAYRYQTNRGLVTTEDLWKMPLQSADGFDLDTTAKELSRKAKELDEESFVTTSTNPERDLYEQQLEVVKYVIAVKLQEKRDAADASKRKAERDELLTLLQEKERREIADLPKEEILQRLASLEKKA